MAVRRLDDLLAIDRVEVPKETLSLEEPIVAPFLDESANILSNQTARRAAIRSFRAIAAGLFGAQSLGGAAAKTRSRPIAKASAASDASGASGATRAQPDRSNRRP
jgi:hypothetical protein